MLKPMFGMGEPDAARIEEALVNLRRYAAVLDLHLEGKTYFIGNALTLADLTLASTLMYAKQVDVPLAEFPHIQAWFSRIAELEAWKQTNP
ncbi:MAG TPA: glutathione binding-like protein [Polyangiales bacterium]|jgi:glutathione S-transferase|nr:glutathione binding-like protein [Polyangiales bacterium]